MINSKCAKEEYNSISIAYAIIHMHNKQGMPWQGPAEPCSQLTLAGRHRVRRTKQTNYLLLCSQGTTLEAPFFRWPSSEAWTYFRVHCNSSTIMASSSALLAPSLPS